MNNKEQINDLIKQFILKTIKEERSVRIKYLGTFMLKPKHRPYESREGNRIKIDNGRIQ